MIALDAVGPDMLNTGDMTSTCDHGRDRRSDHHQAGELTVRAESFKITSKSIRPTSTSTWPY